MSSPNPYAPPTANTDDAPVGATGMAAPYKLYSPGHVGIATFFGTPLAGAIVMALNDRAIGERRRATYTVVVGVVIMAALTALLMFLPQNPPGFVISVGGVLCMHAWARLRYRMIFEVHERAGGKIGSGWVAFGIAMATVAAIVVVIIGVVLVREGLGE